MKEDLVEAASSADRSPPRPLTDKLRSVLASFSGGALTTSHSVGQDQLLTLKLPILVWTLPAQPLGFPATESSPAASCPPGPEGCFFSFTHQNEVTASGPVHPLSHGSPLPSTLTLSSLQACWLLPAFLQQPLHRLPVPSHLLSSPCHSPELQSHGVASRLRVPSWPPVAFRT